MKRILTFVICVAILLTTTGTAVFAAAKNPFTVAQNEIYELYLYNPKAHSYTMLENYFYSPRQEPDHAIVLALNALPALPKLDKKPDSSVETGFLIIRGGYKKTQINLYERALEVGGAYYTLTQQQYDQLKKLASGAMKPDVPFGEYAQWLVWMNPERVTSIKCTDETGRSFSVKKKNLLLAAMEPRYLGVSGGKTYKAGSRDFSKMKDAFTMVLTFDNGITYTMVLAGENVYLESSDKTRGCRYKTYSVGAESFIDAMKNAEKGIMSPRTGKPVIYLYPEKTRDISVKLDFKGDLFYTYPAYNGGWSVTAEPDGTLMNKADGSTHYYLFWDGTSSFRDWDFSEGFVVKGSEAESFFREKLPAMGLTPREYNDFITYWTPELSQNEYNLVTFSTEQYEAIAKLGINPVPDTVLRVHMVYKPISAPVRIKEQKLPEAPERRGFTVVEWGGTRAK